MTKMENDYKRKGMVAAAEIHKQRGEEIEIHIDRLKEILYSTQKSDPS